MKKVEDIGMYYSTGADGDISEELERVAVADFGEYIVKMGAIKGYANIAVILNRWYCKANGGDPVSIDDLLLLPKDDFDALYQNVLEALSSGGKQTVKTKKSKNAKTAHAK